MTEEKQISKRRQKMRDEDFLSPIDQVRMMGDYEGKPLTGSWAYYLRPEGATIRDVLVISPNGGIPDIDDPRRRGKYAMNHELYRQKEEAKGHIYVGQRLSEASVKKLIEIIVNNREEERMFLEEEIEEAENIIKNSDRPDMRDLQRKRVRDLKTRLHYVTMELDADELLEQMNEISRMQRLASLPPQLLRVMREEISENNQRLLDRLATGRRAVKGAKPVTSSDNEFANLTEDDV